MFIATKRDEIMSSRFVISINMFPQPLPIYTNKITVLARKTEWVHMFSLDMFQHVCLILWLGQTFCTSLVGSRIARGLWHIERIKRIEICSGNQNVTGTADSWRHSMLAFYMHDKIGFDLWTLFTFCSTPSAISLFECQLKGPKLKIKTMNLVHFIPIKCYHESCSCFLLECA